MQNKDSPVKTFLSPQPTYKEITTQKSFSVDHILESEILNAHDKVKLVEHITPTF